MAGSEEIGVRAGDAVLSGTLRLPEPASRTDPDGRVPNVLLLGSWLPRDRDGGWDRAGHPTWFTPSDRAPGLLARLADALASRGVASLRCDPRGCAQSPGAWEAVPLFTKIDDARDMLASMRSQGHLDLRRTGIVGHGEGAVTALAVAVSDPAIGALTLIGPPARSWRDVLRRGVAARARSGVDRQHDIVAALDRWSEDLVERAERHERAFDLRLREGEAVPLELAGIEQAMRTPARALAAMLHRSVTLVHGAEDQWSDPGESELLAAALADAGNRPDRRLLPGSGHDLAEASDGVIGELADDLAARLLPRDLPPVLVAIEEMG